MDRDVPSPRSCDSQSLRALTAASPLSGSNSMAKTTRPATSATPDKALALPTGTSGDGVANPSIPSRTPENSNPNKRLASERKHHRPFDPESLRSPKFRESEGHGAAGC